MAPSSLPERARTHMTPSEPIGSVSAVSVVAHAACALLLAVTFAHLSRLFARPYLRSWAAAWGCLLAALVAVRVYIATTERGWWLLYLVAEWAFLGALLAGCREMARGGEPPKSEGKPPKSEGKPPKSDGKVRIRRFALAGLLAAAVLAGTLVPFFPDFDALFSVQAGVLAAGFAAAFALLAALPPGRRSVGFHLMRGALGWLTVQFALYVPLYAVTTPERLGAAYTWLSYSSLADLCAQLLLGIGMLLVAAEEAQRDLAEAVADLRAARDRLAAEVYFDPLTRALNRHAFQALLTGEAGLPSGGHGSLAMIDLDHLKEINDSFGHHAGDAAIRAATEAIRRQLRGVDLLFRWGGDEFLVLLPDCTPADAAERLAPLAEGALYTVSPGEDKRLALTWGVAELSGASEQGAVDAAIARADQAMYGVRAATRPAPAGGPS
jgi:diguanylate cyclase (GGDEF)-like protein